MGRIRIRDISRTGAPGEEQSCCDMTGGMTEVGLRPRVSSVDLMRVAERNGEWIFFGPVQSQVRNDRKHPEVAGRTLRWWRLEVRVRRARGAEPGLDGARPGEDVVVAEWPWSQEWVHAARLRRANKDGRAIDGAWASLSDAELIRRLDKDLAYDHFETNGDYLTAAISEPDQPLGLSHPRDEHERTCEVFGLCPGFDACVRALLETPAVADLLSLTAKGTLDAVPADARQHGVESRLPQEARDEGNSLMLLSIRQALAGPADGDDHASQGRLVTDLVGQIYRGHVWNLAKRIAARDGKASGRSKEEPA
ncbi:MAG: hypothetical protein HY812_17605 [Planctomycetes bacterium]|nr:hypothetical protein [Planctomycetota bacterium]